MGAREGVGQGRGFTKRSLREERVTHMSGLAPSCFLPPQPGLGGHVHPAATASALNSLVAEETIRVPAGRADEVLLSLQLPWLLMVSTNQTPLGSFPPRGWHNELRQLRAASSLALLLLQWKRRKKMGSDFQWREK